MERDINQLLPIVKQKLLEFQAKAKAQGVDFIVTSVYRSSLEQDNLFLRPFDGIDNDKDGRVDEADEKITNARGGQSYHNWRCAFDIVPIVQGKAIWSNQSLWNKLGAIGQSCGLEWGGSWTGFVDMPHFQYTAGYTFKDFIDNKVDYKKFDLPTAPVTPAPVVAQPVAQVDTITPLRLKLISQLDAKDFKGAKDTTSYLFTELAKKLN